MIKRGDIGDQTPNSDKPVQVKSSQQRTPKEAADDAESGPMSRIHDAIAATPPPKKR